MHSQLTTIIDTVERVKNDRFNPETFITSRKVSTNDMVFSYSYLLGNLYIKGAFVPHWLWFLFVPVYIYKRQKRNGNSRWWVVFWLISVIMGLVVSAATMAVFHPQGY